MQISVRSYLTAGTVAVVGAGAIALTPVVTTAPMPGLPAPAVAEVALTGLSLSLTDVLGLLDGLGIVGAVPDFLTSMGSLLPTDIVTAVVTEFVNQASPLLLATAGEVFDYLGAAIAGLISGPESIPVRFGDALAAIPVTLGSALQSLGTGDLVTAIQTVSDGLAAPVQGITAALTEAGQAFQAFLTTEFTGLVGALPGVLLAAVQTVITTNVQSLIDTVTNALSGLLGGLVPGSAAVVAGAGANMGAMAAIRASDSAAVAELPAAAVPVTVTPKAAAAVSAAEEPAAQMVSTAVGARVSGSAPRSHAAGAEAAEAVSDPEPAAISRSEAGTHTAPAKADAARGAHRSTR